MTENENYYIFENNNRFSKKYYTLDQAIFFNSTLKNCYNCIDCVYCENCENCINCKHCKYCEKCSWCRDCQNLKNRRLFLQNRL